MPTQEFSIILQAITAVAVAVGVYFTYRTQAMAVQAKLAADLTAITAKEAQATAIETKAALAQVAISIDGNLHRMLELTERSSRAEGILEGQTSGRIVAEAQEDRAHAILSAAREESLAAPVDVESISPAAAKAISDATNKTSETNKENPAP